MDHRLEAMKPPRALTDRERMLQGIGDPTLVTGPAHSLTPNFEVIPQRKLAFVPVREGHKILKIEGDYTRTVDEADIIEDDAYAISFDSVTGQWVGAHGRRLNCLIEGDGYTFALVRHNEITPPLGPTFKTPAEWVAWINEGILEARAHAARAKREGR